MVNLAPSSFTQSLRRQRNEATMTSRVRIVRGSLGTLDRDTGQVGGLGNAQTVYRGKARIRAVNGNRVESLGGAEQVTRDTVVTIPFAAPTPQRDDIVLIVDEGDPDLSEVALRVLGVDAGGLFHDGRRLSCSGFGRSREWQPE